MPVTRGRFALVAVACAALLAAAGSGQAALSGDFAGLVDIGGGRQMYLERRGTGSPTIVLVAGLKASAEDWSIAEKTAPTVFPEVAKLTRVCAYDRPRTRSVRSRVAATRWRSRPRRGMRSPICMPC
jgi:hypothetical protein